MLFVTIIIILLTGIVPCYLILLFHCCSVGNIWDNVEILDKESNYKKRLISEMVYIKKQKKPLNEQRDTDNLNRIYDKILNMFDPFLLYG